MNGRCGLLANKITGTEVFRCPSTALKFHYHGTDRRQPYRLLVGGSICQHKHTTLEAAAACTRAA